MCDAALRAIGGRPVQVHFNCHIMASAYSVRLNYEVDACNPHGRSDYLNQHIC